MVVRFALGVVWLQQQAELPGWRGGVAGVPLAGCGVGCCDLGLRRRRRRFSRTGTARSAALNACGDGVLSPVGARSVVGHWCAGFGYAAWRADVRLAASLPLAWEGRDIDGPAASKACLRATITARVFCSMSSRWTHTKRDRCRRRGYLSTRHSACMDCRRSFRRRFGPASAGVCACGLKRPHGNANFGLRDAEAALLARNVRATGYVSAAAQAVRWRPDARGVGVTVDRWRALRCGHESTRWLGSAPHRGIVVALAIGAQDEISDADWQLMRATGTSHLVAISGLALSALPRGSPLGSRALSGGASGWIGRATGRCWLPAQIVAVTGGALYPRCTRRWPVSTCPCNARCGWQASSRSPM